MTGKQETIDELNDLLDTLSEVRAVQILSKLTWLDLLDLQKAVEAALKDREQEVTERLSETQGRNEGT